MDFNNDFPPRHSEYDMGHRENKDMERDLSASSVYYSDNDADMGDELSRLESMYPETYQRIMPNIQAVVQSVGERSIDEDMLEQMVSEVLSRSGYFEDDAVETVSYGRGCGSRGCGRPGNDFIRSLLIGQLLRRNRYYGDGYPYYPYDPYYYGYPSYHHHRHNGRRY